MFFFCLVSSTGVVSDAQASQLKSLPDIIPIIAKTGDGTGADALPVALAANQFRPEFKRRTDTALARRWGMSRPRVEAETEWLASCATGACRDRRVEPWSKTVAVLRAAPRKNRPALVQKLLSRRIDYVGDKAIDDHWANPLATLLSRAGDCEDHALLKRAMLMAAGYSDAEVPLLVLETAKGQGHMTLLVAHKDHVLVLDNRFRAAVPLSFLTSDKVVALASSAGYFVAK